MHLPNISSTLPRRWKLSSTNDLSSDKRPPKPHHSSLTRRFSISSKPPRPGGLNSPLFRSASFTLPTSDGEFDFKKPLPPPPSVTATRPSKPPRTPSFLRRKKKAASSSLSEQERSQSLVDLQQQQVTYQDSHCCNCHRQSERLRSLSFDNSSKANTTFAVATPPTLNDKSFTTTTTPRQQISTASIFSKNLRSNSWRNLTAIGRIPPTSESFLFASMSFFFKHFFCAKMHVTADNFLPLDSSCYNNYNKHVARCAF